MRCIRYHAIFNSQLTNTKTRQLTRKGIMCITLLYIYLIVVEERSSSSLCNVLLASLAYSLLYCRVFYIEDTYKILFVFCCCNKHAYTCTAEEDRTQYICLVYSVKYIEIVDKWSIEGYCCGRRLRSDLP